MIAEEDSLDPIGDEFEQHSEYLNRCRRVPIGPSVTVVFENTRTLWLRLRELARFARATDPARIHREMDWYDSLLPGPGRLLASVSVRAPTREVARSLDSGTIELRVGPHRIPGLLRADAAGDRVVGLVRWVEFKLTRPDAAILAQRDQTLSLSIEAGRYSHESQLTSAIRSSLVADLQSKGL